MKSIWSIAGAVVFLAAAWAGYHALPEKSDPGLGPVTGDKVAELMSRQVDVLIATQSHDYSGVTETIEQGGGTVTHAFKYARGLAAQVPVALLTKVKKLPGVTGIGPDEIRTPAAADHRYRLDTPVLPLGFPLSQINEMDAKIASGVAFDLEAKFDVGTKVTLDSVQLQALASGMTPDTYANAIFQNALPVWATGNFGANTIVAVIDSGIWGDHFTLAGSLIGCEDFTTESGAPGDPDLPCSDPGNNPHGTHVSSIIAGHGIAVLGSSHPIATAIARHTGPLQNAAPFGFPGGVLLPLLGIAPDAELYGLKVFPANGGGAPTSRIIAAIERAIELKNDEGVDIDVINMSLGGGTTFVGRDLESQAVDAATGAGITVVTSAGNDGPASQTIGSPAGAHSAIDTGAITTPLHARVFWDLNFFPAFMGHKLFVGDDPQMIYFSSRGFTEDGRNKPVVSAPGVFILGALPSAGSPNGLGFLSGTSMSSPGVAGTAALLNHWSEDNGDLASPFDHFQAITAGAQPIPGYGVFEQGAGLNNAWAALDALMNDAVLGEAFPPIPAADPGSPLPPNGVTLGLVPGVPETIQVNNLMPGMSRHYYFPSSRDTSHIIVDVSNFKTKKNPLGLNSFEIYLKTGTRTYLDYYAESVNVAGNAHFEIMDRSTTVTGNVFGVITQDPLIQPGYTRFTIENDWTSAGPVSGTFDVTVLQDPKPAPDISFSDSVGDGGSELVPGPVAGFFFPCAGFGCRTDLTWPNDWTAYPTTDLDLLGFGFDTGVGGFTFVEIGSASLSAPETNTGFLIPLTDPAQDPANVGFVVLQVEGFDTHGTVEPYTMDYFNPAP